MSTINANNIQSFTTAVNSFNSKIAQNSKAVAEQLNIAGGTAVAKEGGTESQGLTLVKATEVANKFATLAKAYSVTNNAGLLDQMSSLADANPVVYEMIVKDNVNQVESRESTLAAAKEVTEDESTKPNP